MIGIIFAVVYFAGMMVTCAIIDRNSTNEEKHERGYSAIIILASLFWMFLLIPVIIKIKGR